VDRVTVWYSARDKCGPLRRQVSGGIFDERAQALGPHRLLRESSTTFGRTSSDGSIWGMDFSVYAEGPQPQAFVAGQSVDGNWSSGGADCRVDLLRYSSNYSRSTILASSSFTVAS